MQKVSSILILVAFILLSSMPVLSLPTGISTNNGPIFTRAVLGYVNITDLLAYNASSDYPYGASLQLNVMLMANTSEGNLYYFWLQNVAEFLTNESRMNFVDNIWNATNPFAGISNVSGNGETYPLLNVFYHSSYYAYGTPEINYTFPFAFYFLISENYNSSGVKINFSYVILQNGKILPPNPVTYDSVFIPIQNLQTAYIVINDSMTPNASVGIITYLGNLLDAELVWGGYGNGESTTFQKMSSYLGLFYFSDKQFVPFDTVYNYGFDTEESANDLQVTLANNGDAYVSLGNPNYGLLTDNFHPYIPGFTFVNISSKIPFLINNTFLTTNYTGYITSPLTIFFYKNYSVNSSSFVLLSYPTSNITISSSNNFRNVSITPKYTYYYLIKINSNIPVLLNVNGNLTLTNKPIWVVQNSNINLVNYTYYISSGERLVVNNTYPSLPIIVKSPMTINVGFIKQYRVEINSTQTVIGAVNGQKLQFNGTNWIPQGSQISLKINLPIYEQGKFIGTYNVSPGEKIVVNGPIYEKLVVYPNYYFIIAIVILIVLGVAIIISLRKRK
ncbi:thermopsin [Sulfolobus sp. A20]|uniref:thermopsin family protease n=1 Tax=Saccharolobus sp. A20 TaxID=1891280 RepID=UPI00084602BE|nr:thermopsin family protease [Sulfolobus sp. A20]TRM76286.1 thermopsin [Sulfolobus sp. A20-N-F8]TRM81814.1 thermopsin [Sulfolobus sp. D5]TRM83811.1 thermopsin [Sulfolobus sp. A20-N-F6]TRM89683.1 thermopsin [Sulfolobus sp. C3]TRN00951.1 thermopsin [Sulfolobus sp. F1]TRN01726.1 thermopsin [Sulfolobus sp. E1]